MVSTAQGVTTPAAAAFAAAVAGRVEVTAVLLLSVLAAERRGEAERELTAVCCRERAFVWLASRAWACAVIRWAGGFWPRPWVLPAAAAVAGGGWTRWWGTPLHSPGG